MSRLLQEISILIRLFGKLHFEYYCVKYRYIKPDSKFGFWKYEVFNEYGEKILEN